MRIILVFLILTLSTYQIKAQDFKFGKVSKEELEEEAYPLDESAHAAILYRNQKIHYEIDKSTGFTLVTEVQERIKIYDKEGFDWATKIIELYVKNSDEEKVTNIKAYTYNFVDGKIEDEKLNRSEIIDERVSNYRNITKFTMPALKEGSIIEYSYTIRSPFLTNISTTPLQFRIPVKKLDLEVLIPEFFVFSRYFNTRSPLIFNLETNKKNFVYTYTSHERNTVGGSGFGSNSALGSRMKTNKIDYLQNVYEISSVDIPALIEEPHVDYLDNYAASINWELQMTNFPGKPMKNYSETWESVTNSIYDDVGMASELNKSGYFEKDIDALLAGMPDPLTKANKIFNFLKNKVKWNNYVGYYWENGLRKAYKEGIGNTGDINLMLTAMLKYAGLNAHPLLLSTSDNGIPVFPTRNGFNYMVASLELPNQIILMDATDPLAAMGELPKRARNWQGRLLRERGSSTWVNLRPTLQSQLQEQLNIKLEENQIKGESINLYDGLYAKDYREKFLGRDKLDYAGHLETEYGGITIRDLKTENDQKIGSKIKETYSFEATNGIEVIGDKIYIKPMLFKAMIENPFKSEDRHYPVFFEYPIHKKNIVNIMLPEGYHLISAPESAAVILNGSAGEFKYIFVQNGNFLRIESEINLKNTVFTTQDYGALREFYANIIKKHSETLVLEKV